MPIHDTTLLYVENLDASLAFYNRVLAAEPVHASPNFALYAASTGKLALWQRSDVDPPIDSVIGGGAELNFGVASRAQVEELFDRWEENGVRMLQKPFDHKDAGYTFVAVDPDEHRLRVFYSADGN